MNNDNTLLSSSYHDIIPELANEVKQSTSLCKEQLTESAKMLRKIEQTAAAVLQMLPDLELAIEEGKYYFINIYYYYIVILLININYYLINVKVNLN